MCDTKIGFLNRATMGNKTLDEKKICHNCVKKIAPVVGVLGAKKFMVSELKKILINEKIYSPKNCLICNKDINSIFKRNINLHFLCDGCCSKFDKHRIKEIKSAFEQLRVDDVYGILINQNLLPPSEAVISKKSVDTSNSQYDIPYMEKIVEQCCENEQQAILERVAPAFQKLTYKGGHPDYTNQAEVSLAETNEGIIVIDSKIFKKSDGRLGRLFSIPWQKITGISTNTQLETKDNNKMAAAGILLGRNDLALIAASMRKEKKHNFLLINYNLGKFESVIKFEGDCAEDASAYFIGAFNKYNIGTSPSDDKVKQDTINQIRRLAELTKEGILTENEFAEKKQKLLAQI